MTLYKMLLKLDYCVCVAWAHVHLHPELKEDNPQLWFEKPLLGGEERLLAPGVRMAWEVGVGVP